MRRATAKGLAAPRGSCQSDGKGKATQMNIVEPIADAVTGGVVATTAEPRTGVDATGHTTEQACLNCQTPLVGSYCHACGQRGHVHRRLAAFGHDLLHGVFHFEGKIWRTLPMLLFRPGELTRRYIAGERARFVSPVALFLFTVFLMFAVVSAIGGPVSFARSANSPEERARLDREYKDNRTEMLGQLEALQAERNRRVQAKTDTVVIDKRIADKQAELRVQKELYGAASAVVGGTDEASTPTLPNDMTDGPDESNIVVVSGADEVNNWFDHAYKKAKKNPSLLLYKLQNNGYKYSWALIPLSVPFVWLLFLHRRRYWQYKAYDHTVFVTYSITFMSVGFILLTLLRPLGLPSGWALTAMTFIPPIHIYKQLRGAYQLSRFSALWRTLTLIVCATIAASLFAMLLLLLGVLG